jgi:CBS domain-containing protein
MPDRMNINAPLDEEFKQFTDTKVIGSMKSLQPTDLVAVLDATMKRGGLGGKPIRHVPIIEPEDPKQPQRGELRALISKIDVATLLSPPWDLIPKEVIDQGMIDLISLSQDIKSVSRQSIKVAFQELFSGTPPKIYWKGTLEDAMNLLTSTYKFDAGGITKTRRYKTVPVFNDQKTLIGMLSYMDFLREIKDRDEAHSSFLKKTAKDLLKEIGQKIEGIETMDSDGSIFEATGLFSRVPFTHLPIKTGEFVTGVIDDVLVNTYEHQALISAFATVPLAKLATPIKPGKNVVSLNDPLSEVIERFFLDDRPTAVLVGEMRDGKFQMKGIISYLDILRNFKNTFLSSVSSLQPSPAPTLAE